LRNLLDVAVKAGGMRAAPFALELDQIILRAAQEDKERVQVQPKKNSGSLDISP